MLQRATDWISTGGGNHQIRAGKPGSSTCGATGREGGSGSGARSCRKGVGSGQTCPVGPRGVVVLADGRCRCSAARGRACRGSAAGLLDIGCRPDSGIQRREIEGAAKDFGGDGRGLLQSGKHGVGDVAVRGDSGFCGDDGVRGNGTRRRERPVKEGQVWSRCFSRRYRVRARGVRRQRVRHHRVGRHRVGRHRRRECWIDDRRRGIQDRAGYGQRWIRRDDGWRGVRGGSRVGHFRVRRGRRRGAGAGGCWGWCRAGDRLGRGFRSRHGSGFGGGFRSGRGVRRCCGLGRRLRNRSRLGSRHGCGLGGRFGSRCRHRCGNSSLGRRDRNAGGRVRGGGRDRDNGPGRFPGHGAGPDSGLDGRGSRRRCNNECGDGVRGDRDDSCGRGGCCRGGGGGVVGGGSCRGEGQPGDSGDTSQNDPPERAAHAQRD